MLSLDICKRLKECGYIQNRSTALIYYLAYDNGANDLIDWGKYDNDFRGYADAPELCLACPNSDELIAAIRERWPKIGNGESDINGAIFGWHGGWQIYDYDTDDMSPPTLACGDTLVDALAELYITLNKGDGNG